MSDHYVISKRSGGWGIAVDGSMLLICERKKAALRAVRDAAARRETLAGHPHRRRAEPPAKSLEDAEHPMAAAR